LKSRLYTGYAKLSLMKMIFLLPDHYRSLWWKRSARKFTSGV